jgi:energy-coupling factor transporter ATP-binding protein EcfA2
VLFLAHRAELLAQTARTLGGDVRVVQADRDTGPAASPVVVASVQTVAAPRWAERLPPADLVIIDEPTEGLAPKIVDLVAQFLKVLRARGLSVLLIEQKLTIALQISDRCLVMGHGRVVFEGAPAALSADTAVRRDWLEV